MNTTEHDRVGRIARRVLLPAGLTFMTGCLAIPLGRSQGSPAVGPGSPPGAPSSPALGPSSTAQGNDSPTLQHKKVAQKEEPNILIAADQTRCEVDRTKFESVKQGDAVWCVWRQ